LYKILIFIASLFKQKLEGKMKHNILYIFLFIFFSLSAVASTTEVKNIHCQNSIEELTLSQSTSNLEWKWVSKDKIEIINIYKNLFPHSSHTPKVNSISLKSLANNFHCIWDQNISEPTGECQVNTYQNNLLSFFDMNHPDAHYFWQGPALSIEIHDSQNHPIEEINFTIRFYKYLSIIKSFNKMQCLYNEQNPL